METQLVISNVSEKYGHVSSLGVGASLFVFISTALDHFSLSYYAFVLVTRSSLCSGVEAGGAENIFIFHIFFYHFNLFFQLTCR